MAQVSFEIKCHLTFIECASPATAVFPFCFYTFPCSIMSHSVVPSDAKLAKAVNYVAAQLRVAGKSVKQKIANDDAHDKKCDEKLQRKLL